jgi:phosphomannomutase / phosphoglucomutase
MPLEDQMLLEPTMFREYDIRGRETGAELNQQTMEYLGKGYGTFLSRRGIKRCVVGRDCRATSAEFEAAFIEGLVSTGCEVLDIGLSTTPMLYWAQFHFESIGGAAITASHNPAGWNGVKLAVGYSQTTNSQQLQEMYQLIKDEDFENGIGKVTQTPIDDEYIKDLTGRVQITGNPKILLNTGNGTAGVIGPRLLRAAGCDVTELHTRLDPTFPHYPANPSIVEMMEDTGDHVRKANAELGVAIDADGDRLGITDEKGKTHWPDVYMIPIVRELCAEKPGAKIVYDVKCSLALEEEIREHGGVPIMWKTGHSYIKQKIAEEKADLGVELSGHIFIVHGYYGFDDALFSGLRLIESLQKRGVKLSEMRSAHDKWATSPVYNVYCADDVKYRISEELIQRFRSMGYQVIDLSGARVVFADGWGLVRASSNLPQLVLRFEARTAEKLKEREEMFRNILKEYPGVGTEWETG